MRGFPCLRPITVAVLLAFCASCATTRLPPISDAADQFEPLNDERQLWERAREEEAKLAKNVTLYPDPLLEGYLDGIVARLNPPGMAANPDVRYRVFVVEDPTLNAFAYPHGSLYVHTGLLARMESEDQLATVLAHEMTHVENRHMLRYDRSARNKQIGWSIAAVAATVVIASEQGDALESGHWGKAATIGVVGSIVVGLGLQLAILASVNGYGRDLEYEADQGAFAKMAAAGYDPGQAPGVYEALLAEYGDSSGAEVFFFGSHPQLAERVENAEQWLGEHPDHPVAGGGGDPGEFLRRMRPVIRDDAGLNLEMGRLELAEHELNRALELMPGDPETWLLVGRLRLMLSEAEQEAGRSEPLRDEARDAFREAVRLDADRPRPHLELGLLAYDDGDFATACVEFRQYLELDPRADEAPRVRDYILELETDRLCP